MVSPTLQRERDSKDALLLVRTRIRKKLEQLPLVAANGCPINPARLFVVDKTTKYRYLVITVSDVCVFPRKLIPSRKDRVNYDFYIANGSTIDMNGWTLTNVDFELRRDLVWRLVVADVEVWIIGVDFLSFYNLLVDCRNNRQLDGTTTFSMLGFTVSDKVASLNTIHVNMEEVLQEFPDLTRPTGKPRECDTTPSTASEQRQVPQCLTVHDVSLSPSPQDSES